MFKLRWLTGPLSGYEFKLPQGDTCLGGKNADIDFALDEENALTLVVENSEISVRTAAPFWVDGKRWKSARPLPHHVAIQTASIAFVLGKEGEPLPMITLPTIQGKYASFTRKAGMAAIFTVVVLASTFLVFWKRPALAGFDALQWTTDQISRTQGLAGLHVQTNANGHLQISGLCQNSKAVAELKNTLRAEGIWVYDSSLCRDSLLANVQSILFQNGYTEISLSFNAADEALHIEGDITANPRWFKTEKQLKKIPYIKKWEVINHRDYWFSLLLQTLMQYNLIDQLSITTSEKTFLITGIISPETKETLQTAMNAFNQESHEGYIARFQAIPSANTLSSLLPASIATIGGNNKDIFIILSNGMRLQTGGVLPNGYAILSLSRKAITLRKNQNLISVPINI
ncbi:EscD/YscD/HrpQ family type III secretion system inner membrane ring protein [Enterobacterales bacterium CwR94]|nr:EscD/YscD/HrpQ family type III secretion system inner membrane ring protein [Enterobacterales bacterium CwR94]